MLFSYNNLDVLNAKQVARYTGYTLNTIRTYCSLGEIPHSNPTGGKLQFDKIRRYSPLEFDPPAPAAIVVQPSQIDHVDLTL